MRKYPREINGSARTHLVVNEAQNLYYVNNNIRTILYIEPASNLGQVSRRSGTCLCYTDCSSNGRSHFYLDISRKSPHTTECLKAVAADRSPTSLDVCTYQVENTSFPRSGNTELPAGVGVVGKSFVGNNRRLRLVRWNPTSARAQQGDPRLGLARRALR